MAKAKRRKPYVIEWRFTATRPYSIFIGLNLDVWMVFRRYSSESARNQALTVMVKKETNKPSWYRYQTTYRKKKDL